MGGVNWCPQVSECRFKIDYIKACILHKKGTKINKRTLLKNKSKRARLNASELPMQKLLSILDDAFQEYKELKQQHVNKARTSYLEDLAEALAENGNVKKATHLRKLIRIEEQRAMYKKLKYITGQSSNLGTTFVSFLTYIII